ncbi:MAG: hypothetical protein V1761_01345 [bacterium]
MTNEMIKTIEAVGKVLNDTGILWAIGGSVVLQTNGMPVTPNDLDVIIETKDAPAVVQLLESLGAKRASDPSYHYQSYSFTEYVVGATEVDLMAGLTIVHHGQKYLYPFDATTPTELRVIGKTTVPFMALEDWYVLYNLMPGKAWKAELIAQRFQKDGMKHPGRIEEVIRQMGICDPLREDLLSAL